MANYPSHIIKNCCWSNVSEASLRLALERTFPARDDITTADLTDYFFDGLTVVANDLAPLRKCIPRSSKHPSWYIDSIRQQIKRVRRLERLLHKKYSNRFGEDLLSARTYLCQISGQAVSDWFTHANNSFDALKKLTGSFSSGPATISPDDFADSICTKVAIFTPISIFHSHSMISNISQCRLSS